MSSLIAKYWIILLLAVVVGASGTTSCALSLLNHPESLNSWGVKLKSACNKNGLLIKETKRKICSKIVKLSSASPIPTQK